MRILVVDDMPSMRHVMIRMLNSLGYEDNDEATDGQQAIKLIHSKSYDLVITDFHMPKVDGKQLLKYIRNDTNIQSLPVLMVTCEDTKKNVQDIIESKVNGFIVKPFSAKTLENQISYILKQAS